MESRPFDPLLAARIHKLARWLAKPKSRERGWWVDIRDVEQEAWVAALETPTVTHLRLRGAMIDSLRRWNPQRRAYVDGRRVTQGALVRWGPLSWVDEEELVAQNVDVDRQVLYREVRDAIETLPPRTRETMIARFFDGIPQPTLATRGQVSGNAIRNRRTYGLKLLRQRLGVRT